MTNMGCTNAKALPNGTDTHRSEDCEFKTNCKDRPEEGKANLDAKSSVVNNEVTIKEITKDDNSELDLNKDISETKNDLNKGLKNVELDENKSNQTESKGNTQTESKNEPPVVKNEEFCKKHSLIDQNYNMIADEAGNIFLSAKQTNP